MKSSPWVTSPWRFTRVGPVVKKKIPKTGRPQAPVPAPVDGADGMEAGPSSFKCEFCERSFGTASGRGVHVRRAHEAEYNRRIVVDRTRARWSEEEVRLLAKAEARAVLQGVASRGINAVLYAQFEHRTEDAIKGQRRGKPYRDLVAEYVQSLQAEVVAQEPPGPPEEVADLDPRLHIREAILRDLREAEAEVEEYGGPARGNLSKGLCG